jgi:APA family basic amino acid/polyamine antiporter
MAGFLPLSILAEMTNIGTLLAFVIVCGAVLVMRRTHPDAKRPFRAPLVPLVPILGIITCLLLMFSLPVGNWYRLIIWLLIGFVIYFTYGRRHSVMARHLAHEIGTHGVSPAGQAVADPDSAPGSPSGPVDSHLK